MEVTRNKSSREVAEAFLTYLHSPDADCNAVQADDAPMPVGMDESCRYLVSLENDGIPNVPLIGEAHFRRCYRNIPFHVHPGCYEVTLCLRGNLEYECRGRRYRFQPGDIFAVGPDIPHRPISAPKGFRRYRLLFKMPARETRWLGFSAEEARWLINGIRAIDVRHFSDTGEVRSGFQRVMRIIREIPASTPERRIKLKVAVAQLLLSIVSLINRPLNAYCSNKIKFVVDEMRLHPERKYPVDEIAARLNMSVSTLLHRFKQVTGLPPHAFLTECRIEFAKACLQKSVPVEVVARRTGYISPKQFSAVFHRFTGMPPSRWRKGKKNN